MKQLVDAMGNGMVKIITGVRRCGKSYLLATLFRKHLRAIGVDDSHIHAVSLDLKPFEALQDPNRLYEHFAERIRTDGRTHYVFIDEVQLCRKVLKEGVDPSRVAPEDEDSLYTTFHDTLNSLAALPNVDVYVTGSNSRMLSSDVATEFRGRGMELRMRPLSFAEFLSVHGGEKADAWREYMATGGLPQVVLAPDETAKRRLLATLFSKTYLRDVVERYQIKDEGALGRIVDLLCSAVGPLTNPGRLANEFSSRWKTGPSEPTIRKWLKCLEDAFLFQRADRWDVKGGRYLSSPSKWYATDVGLR
ncbi:MAG: ATP-binding protein, partial [Kiritimatiellae bacterium]|nr:ATP-binding protein [Kiritimatiellia bacterium]